MAVSAIADRSNARKILESVATSRPSRLLERCAWSGGMVPLRTSRRPSRRAVRKSIITSIQRMKSIGAMVTSAPVIIVRIVEMIVRGMFIVD